MFVCNLKVNSSFWFRFLIVFSVLVAIILLVLVVFKIYNSSILYVNDNLNSNEIKDINNKNYASILQASHENIDLYVGKSFKYSGFVYRAYDFNKNQFVLGRNMIISSDFQTVIIGFLCNCSDAISLKDSTWVEIEGTIAKGSYHDQTIPIIEVKNFKQIEKPSDEFVYPPDKDYIPTSYMIY